MRVFVAGGSGAVGRQPIPTLVAQGHAVVATTRSSTKLATIRAWGAEAVVMDGLDPASVEAAVTGARPRGYRPPDDRAGHAEGPASF